MLKLTDKQVYTKSMPLDFYGLSISLFVFYSLFYSSIENNSLIDAQILVWLFAGLIIVLQLFALMLNQIKLRVQYVFVFLPFLIILIISSMLYSPKSIVLQYLILLIFLICPSDNYDYSNLMNLIKSLALIVALSIIFEIAFPSTYINIMKILYNDSVNRWITTIAIRRGYYCGFTTQVGVSAGFCTLGLGICFFELSEKVKKNKTIQIMEIILFILGLVLSSKRAHLVFSLCALIVVFLLAANVHKRMQRFLNSIIIILLVVILGIIILAVSKSNNAITRLVASFVDSGEDITSGRIALYEEAWRLFITHPVLGIGWGNFTKLSLYDIGVHSGYLQVLCETGIVGFGAFLLLLAGMFNNTVKILFRINHMKNYNVKEKYLITLSLYYQLFFIIYSFTGNTVVDQMYFYSYIVFCVIARIYALKYSGHNKSNGEVLA